MKDDDHSQMSKTVAKLLIIPLALLFAGVCYWRVFGYPPIDVRIKQIFYEYPKTAIAITLLLTLLGGSWSYYEYKNGDQSEGLKLFIYGILAFILIIFMAMII